MALERNVNCTLIRVKSAYEAVAQLLQLYESMKPRKRGISDLAFIDPTAAIGEDCYIGPFAYVGPKCVIGDNSIIGGAAFITSSVPANTRVSVNPPKQDFKGKEDHDLKYTELFDWN